MVWNRVTPLQTEVRVPTSSEPGARSLGPFPSLTVVPRPVWDSRKETFSGFFPPFLPNFGDDHAP